MSIMEIRGGVPFIRNITFDTTGRRLPFNGTSKWLSLRAASFPCRAYFTEDDFNADQNYISVPVASTTTPYGEWKGPLEAEQVWIKGIGGSSVVEVVALLRRN